jgi:putative nucleotidyltransferase with HDIG domain
VSTHTLEVLVKRIEQLPSFPTVVHKLIEVCKDPNATMAMVEDVIRTDQSLTARMLKLVNSAFFALSNRVSTIHHAAVILGMDALRNTAIAVCTYECLAGCDANEQFNRRRFWEHAVATGIIAKELAKAARYSKPDEAFVAGLLHDLGKVVLDKYFPEEFGQALGMCQAKEQALSQCEEATLGFSHSTAGAEVARQWLFPEPLTHAIETHHDETTSEPLCALVMLANEMAKAWAFGASGNPLLHPVCPSVWEHVPADEAALREIVEESRGEIIAVQALLRGEEENDSGKRAERGEQSAPGVDPAEATRVAYVTADRGALQPLAVYLERARFDVLVLDASDTIPDEAECLVVQMATAGASSQTFESLAARQSFLRSLPHECVALPCLPGNVVKSLRATVPSSAATV